jgi:2'-5' RNA ligase
MPDDFAGFLQAGKDRLVGLVRDYYGTLDKITADETEFWRQLLAEQATGRHRPYDPKRFDKERLNAAYHLGSQLRDALTELHYRAALIGADGKLSILEAQNAVRGELARQFGFLQGFINDLPRLSQGQAEVRIASYVSAISQSANAPLMAQLPQLPQRPGDGKTECKYWCKCSLDIQEQPGAGNWDIYWRLNRAEHCPDCVRLAATWNPLPIRGWAIQATKAIADEALVRLRAMIAIATAENKTAPGRPAFASLQPGGQDRVAIERVMHDFQYQLLGDTLGLTDLGKMLWIDASLYHITLVYAPTMPEMVLQAVFDRLPKQIAPLQVHSGKLAAFQNPEDKAQAVYLAIDKTPALAALQAQIHEAFSGWTGVELSTFSAPEQWTPHLTLCYLPFGVSLPDFQVDLTFNITELSVARDNYNTVRVIPSVCEVNDAAQS